MEADREFAAETAARGGEGWADWFAQDGVMYPPTGRVDGQDAIRERMVPAFSGDSRLTWDPVTAVIAASGDLGYTLGRWEMFAPDSTGTDVVVATGNYVSIWKKTEDGWRVAVDIGNRDATEE